MNIFEDTNPRALKDLLSDIDSRAMVLPDFQRDFVWDPRETQELIVSIASSYPAGSLLRVRDSSRAFAAREFEGAPALGGGAYTFLVLDGQQRLTSLYQAFFGKGEHRYFLDLNKLMKSNDFEEAIFHERSSSRRAGLLQDFTKQKRELILPLAILRGGSGGFLEWLLEVTNPLAPEERAKLQDALKCINNDWIKAIDDYHFPVVTLSEKTSPAALCTIFETLNRTGVKLSVFELLTARFWPKDIRLRDLWEEAKARHPIFEEFEVDPYYLLQSIELASSAAPSGKKSAVMDLSAQQVREWWAPVVEGLALALSILREDCWVMLPKWLPYQTMLAPMAAVLARQGKLTTPQAGVARHRLARWFWCSVFGQAYESSPNSQGAKDVVDLTSWLAGGLPPEHMRQLKFDPAILQDVTPKQRAIYRGTICLILGSAHGARDFHTQAPITAALIGAEGIDDHHVFPAAYLDRRGGTPARLRDCVLNRTLIDRTTNQMISDRAPSDYLAEIRDTSGFPFELVLGSHSLPSEADSPLLCDDFGGFLSWRQTRLWQEIRRVTGAAESTVLELEDRSPE